MSLKTTKLLSALLLGAFAAVSLYAAGIKPVPSSATKIKPLMTLEYEYSKSGKITARKINGEVQNYKYDKKGQLLGVYDTNGKAVEEYVYDPAGNILKKNLNGKTTAYQYDKANQLVSSVTDGKVTKYEYDAAGRLVKEGDKVYSYIGLDKIESVTENGRRLSSFTYHIDGQLAARVSIESSEEFQWDGLALIQRNNTNYVNEPAVTGGNPILADGKILFNDMLGTTLGVKDGKNVTRNNLTAFGESLNSSLSTENSFFTGKPHVGEMGYTFLFRAYRADQGKWQTSDPLGYPDGWNNLAYVNNGVTMHFDWLGGKIGDGIWELESAGPIDDQRPEIFDEYNIGNDHPYQIIRSWVLVTTINVGSAYLAESYSETNTLTVGCEAKVSLEFIGISVSQSASKDITTTVGTAKGEKAKIEVFQLIETYKFNKNGVPQSIDSRTATIGRVINGWKWLE